MRDLWVPIGSGLALLGSWPWVPAGEERLVAILLGLCGVCLLVGAALVARRRPEAPSGSTVHTADAGESKSCIVGVFRVDPDGRCTWANAGWSQLTGRPREQLQEQLWTDVLHPGERVSARASYQRAVQEGRRLPLDHRVVRPDGEVVQVVGQLSRGDGCYVGMLTAIPGGRVNRAAA